MPMWLPYMVFDFVSSRVFAGLMFLITLFWIKPLNFGAEVAGKVPVVGPVVAGALRLPGHVV
jgi:hypothetical protein